MNGKADKSGVRDRFWMGRHITI